MYQSGPTVLISYLTKVLAKSHFFMVVARNSHYLSQTLGIWWAHFTTFFSITVPFYGLILKATRKGKKMKQQLKVTPGNWINILQSTLALWTPRYNGHRDNTECSKYPSRDKLQTFEWNKLPLLRTLAKEDTNLRSLQCLLNESWLYTNPCS